jgi:hypothetical protein
LSADGLLPFLDVKNKSKVFSSNVKNVDILDTGAGDVQVKIKNSSSKRLDLGSPRLGLWLIFCAVLCLGAAVGGLLQGGGPRLHAWVLPKKA